MHPRIHKAVGAARALASDLGLETSAWEEAVGPVAGPTVVTVAATLSLSGGRSVAKLLAFGLREGVVTISAILRPPREPLTDLAELDAFRDAVTRLTTWGVAAQRLARRLA